MSSTNEQLSTHRITEPGIKRLVISDLHIGSKFYKSNELLRLLETEEFDELVLAGDIIDFIKIPSFTIACAKLINSFAKNKSIKYIIGNHDISFEKWNGLQVCGVTFLRHYEFKCGNRRFFITHGDLYERGLVRFRFVMKVISIFHDILERWLNTDLTTFFHDKFQGSPRIQKIKKLLSQTDTDVFIMGHNHSPEAIIWVNEDLEIKTYVNSGDWVSHSTYVTIDPDGQVRLRKFNA